MVSTAQVVAKALALECMRAAKAQERGCYVFAFAGPQEVCGAVARVACCSFVTCTKACMLGALAARRLIRLCLCGRARSSACRTTAAGAGAGAELHLAAVCKCIVRMRCPNVQVHDLRDISCVCLQVRELELNTTPLPR